MRVLRCLFIFFAGISCHCIAQEGFFCPEIFNYIERNFSCSGVLRNSNGFVYLDLDDKYVHELIHFIQEEGFEEPSYFGRSDSVGAHITVAYPDEIKFYGVETMAEYGETIFFTPKRCKKVHPFSWRGDEVYVIVVEAPELDLIREKYRLPKQKYDFHITIGVKPKAARSA